MGGEATEQRVVTAPNRQREVRFHVEVVPAMADPPVVPCYDAVFSERTGESHLLFRDVSGTHVSVQGQPSPATPQCRRIAEAFGRFHAHWWGHPALGELGDLPSRESVSRDIDSSRQCFPEFASKAADLLSSNELQLYDRVLASLTDLWQRADDRRNLTLIHGDAHFGNVLVPRDARQHGALLVDWQLWNVNWGTDDLANLMALHWSPETRQRLERDLLGVYYNTLAAHGVQAYTWSDCWQDYRLSVVTRVLLMPMWERLGGVPTNAWQADLGRALSAFRDLGCEDLLSM
jgi:aminoglycoside phosphotransferase (APT) family kinase protein